MTKRRKTRRHEPDLDYLRAVLGHMELIEQEIAKRDRAILRAARAGWTMRELAESTGFSASSVCRIINRVERAA